MLITIFDVKKIQTKKSKVIEKSKKNLKITL